jgi:S1-C subfamily serine protease
MRALGLLLVLTLSSPAWPKPKPHRRPPVASRAVEQALRGASVVIEPVGCAGALAATRSLVVTARHCVRRLGQSLDVYLARNQVRRARVVALDERADQAVLLLTAPARLEPLGILRRQAKPGTVVYFAGNPERPTFERARLERIGRCPSLPRLPDALFTTIHGEPGDSGAPLVDDGGRIVGLVHGGARCHIATPGDRLWRLVEGVLERDRRHL